MLDVGLYFDLLNNRRGIRRPDECRRKRQG
jgi:hypothetical protein